MTATCVWSSGRQVLAQLISTEQAKTMEMFGAGQRAPPAAPPHQVADALSPSMLKHLLKAEGGCSRTPVSSQRLGAWSRLADWAEQHCPSSCGRLRSDCYAPGCQAKTHTQPC